MRRARLFATLMLGLLVLAACGRDDYGHDGDHMNGDHMNQPGRMNQDRTESVPAK